MIGRNQKGMSSILFAMIFAIILSLLAVGIATLVRNDQRQTLDQTLGSQAQYAAETAINQVVSDIYNNPAFAGAQDTCISFEVEDGSGVTVPCVKWDDESYDIRLQSVGDDPKKAKVKIADGESPQSFNRPNIVWSAEKYGVYTDAELNSVGFPISINNDKLPVLRFVYTNLSMAEPKIIYLVPTGGSLPATSEYDDINLSATTPSGYVAKVNCSNAKANCSARLINYVQSAVTNNAQVSVVALGQEAATVTLKFYQGNTLKKLSGAQYIIDATAVAQDITKRVVARVPANKQTWNLGFAVSANKFCKDIKLDGAATNNNLKASDNAPTSCP